MKTRQEMIYDFMVALCGNPQLVANEQDVDTEQMAKWVFDTACLMADEYLDNL
jgi:hypothetical protein